MRKREAGFSLIELLIAIAVMGFVLAVGSDMFLGMLRGYKQQSKIAETNIEGMIGLELLRRDLESAGYGLPWSVPATYNEASDATAALYNDAPAGPPRAILAGDDLTAAGKADHADYLVIKAVNICGTDTCTKWTHLLSSGDTTIWNSSNPAKDNLSAATDRVIVLSPGTPAANSRVLVVNGDFSTQFNDLSGFSSSDETRIIYGVAPSGAAPLRMPFNRADYYVSTNPAIIPGRCAPGTGVLVKAVVSQGDGAFDDEAVMPHLLDCVADLQVVAYLDTDLDGQGDAYVDGLLLADAASVRDQLKEMQVYILAHEGQRDGAYTHPGGTITVGKLLGAVLYGRAVDLSGVPDWQRYRWKVYTLIVGPNNLR